MARIIKPLTDTEIKSAKAQGKQYKLYDGEGLVLRISPAGAKSWVFDYKKPITGKRTSISFGKYPAVTLAKARDKRKEAKELLANDIDPKQHKDEQQSASIAVVDNTLTKWADEWKAKKLLEVKETTITKSYNAINRYVLVSIGSMPISEVRAFHVKPLLDDLIKLDKRETVKRLCMAINEIMRLAKAANVIEFNYLHDLTSLFPAAKKKPQPTIKPERLPELMQKIGRANISLVTRCMFELQLHCMTRPKEAATAMWSEFDFENNWWVIPANKMKMEEDHIIPLSDYVVELLKQVQVISGHRPYLFPSNKDPLSHANSQTVNMMLKRNGFKGELVAHGLRALASTTLNENRFEHDIIEKALAHQVKDEVRKAYNRAEYIEPRRKMMNWWSSHIQEASTGKLSVIK